MPNEGMQILLERTPLPEGLSDEDKKVLTQAYEDGMYHYEKMKEAMGKGWTHYEKYHSDELKNVDAVIREIAGEDGVKRFHIFKRAFE